MKYFYVYILKCKDNSYYVGHTDDIEQRIAQHKSKSYPDCYTKTRLPIEVVFIQQFPTREESIVAEQKIKKWTRNKKEALINNNWDKIKELSKKKFKK